MWLVWLVWLVWARVAHATRWLVRQEISPALHLSFLELLGVVRTSQTREFAFQKPKFDTKKAVGNQDATVSLQSGCTVHRAFCTLASLAAQFDFLLLILLLGVFCLCPFVNLSYAVAGCSCFVYFIISCTLLLKTLPCIVVPLDGLLQNRYGLSCLCCLYNTSASLGLALAVRRPTSYLIT